MTTFKTLMMNGTETRQNFGMPAGLTGKDLVDAAARAQRWLNDNCDLAPMNGWVVIGYKRNEGHDEVLDNGATVAICFDEVLLNVKTGDKAVEQYGAGFDVYGDGTTILNTVYSDRAVITPVNRITRTAH